jgi:hypothetical protein
MIKLHIIASAPPPSAKPITVATTEQFCAHPANSNTAP